MASNNVEGFNAGNPEESKDEVTGLKRSRNAYKGKYSHALSELENAIHFSSSKAIVNAKLDNAIKAYDRFVKAHNKYMSVLEPNGSDYEREFNVLDNYEDDVQLRTRVEKWLRECDQREPPLRKRNQSSCSSSCSSKSSRAVRMEQLERRQEDDRKIEDLQRMLREAAERRRLQDELDKEELDEVRSNHSVKYIETPFQVERQLPIKHQYPQPPLNPRAEEFDAKPVRRSRVVDNTEDLVNQLRMVIDLPKIQVPMFSGDPSDYALFTYTFDNFVSTAVVNERLKLNYLIQFCTGAAHRSIKDYVLLGEGGYEAARKTLFERFGRPHIIMESQVDNLINGPCIKPNDGNGLLDLATDMRRCELISRNLNFQSDVHNSQTILKIMLRLPLYLQTKWSSVANSIYETGREPNFCDLSSVVQNAANVATNFYGKHISSQKTETETPHKIFATTQKFLSDSCCPFCQESHRLYECNVFKQASMKDRVEFMHNTNRCFNCLKVGHIVRGCLSKFRCQVQGCNSAHHTLLHRKESSDYNTPEDAPEGRESSQASSSNSLSCNMLRRSSNILLQIIPVKIVSGEKEVLTNALLDSGSQLSLCTTEMLKSLSCSMSEADINISTVEGSTSMKTFRSSVKIMSMDGESLVDIPEVYSIKSLPALDNEVVSSSQDVSSFSHLKDIPFPPLNPGGVGILIGANVPELFYTLEQTPLRKGEPYASRCLLGWTLIGPTTSELTSSVVNHCNHVILKDSERFNWTRGVALEQDLNALKPESEVPNIAEPATYELIDEYVLSRQTHPSNLIMYVATFMCILLAFMVPLCPVKLLSTQSDVGCFEAACKNIHGSFRSWVNVLDTLFKPLVHCWIVPKLFTKSKCQRHFVGMPPDLTHCTAVVLVLR